MEPSKVYFCDLHTHLGDGLPNKLKRLIKKAGIGQIDFANKYVAIKMNLGEPGNLSYLRPNYARAVADVVRELGGKPFVTDCNTLYVGGRKNGLDHLDSAYVNGFNPFQTGCHTIIADGIKGLDEVEVPVAGGEYVKNAKIGRAIMDADVVISLTHFKGHAMGGFGGSMKNIAIGCADGRIGKAQVHAVDDVNKPWDQWPAKEHLMETMAESAKAVIDYFGKHIVFINVMRRMSVDCDCAGTSAAEPTIEDVGILASTDLLAIDQASVDLVYQTAHNHDLVERIESRVGMHQLEAMRSLGMGSDRYALIEV